MAETYADPDGVNLDLERPIDRLHHEVRYLPCSPQCAKWLRYRVQPENPGPGLRPGWCSSKAHDRDNLGLAGRRVLVSRQWSGKTLSQHRADRATVVREALHEAGIVAPEIERMESDVLSADGKPRFVWTNTQPDPQLYARIILASIAERQRWKAQYDAAKQSRQPVDSLSATGPAPDQAQTLRQKVTDRSVSASPITAKSLGLRMAVKGERSESRSDTEGALMGSTETKPSNVGEAETP